MIKVIEWLCDRVRLLDQSQLPHNIVFLELSDYQEIIRAIKSLKVRGAPAIGITAAYGIALGAMSIRAKNNTEFIKSLNSILDEFAHARPTAVNLFFAINTMKKSIESTDTREKITDILIKTALMIHKNEERAMEELSKKGARLIKDGYTVLTHCNTGALATGVRYGTALGVIKKAKEQGKKIHVYANETRPVLQGSRLTAWELIQYKIPVTLITDSMAGYFLSKGIISCVIVGADRIATNGDTANKIGTYGLAVIARENNVPFYVAAPTSSIDLNIKSGREINIEERPAQEVTEIMGLKIAPDKVHALNPAFDVTPAKYITAFITEKGIVNRPYQQKLKTIVREGKR